MDRVLKLLLVANLIVMLFVGATFVNAHGGDSTMIHACVLPSSGTMRIIGANEQCKTNEVPLDWSTQGGLGEARFAKLPPFVCPVCNLQDNYGVSIGNRLAGKDLTNAYLPGATLARLDLTGTIFTGAELRFANFGESNLSNAKLQHAILINATLSEVNMSNADLTGADLENADLTVSNLNGAILSSVHWLNTTCPDGTNSDNNGGTCEGHLTP